MTSDSAETPESAPLGMKATCLLVGVAALVTFLQGVRYLWQAELVKSSVGILLVALGAIELKVTEGLWTLDYRSWVAAVGLFVVTSAVALVRVVYFGDLLAVLELLVDAGIALYVYQKRPYYDPSVDPEDTGVPLLGNPFGRVDVSERETAPLGMKAIVVVGGVVTLVAFFQGVFYLWQAGDAMTYVGVLVIGFAGLQAYALRGLWNLERWAWFAALFFFVLATALALVRVVGFHDSFAVLEFFVDALLTAYVSRKKEWYAPNISVDVTPS